MKTGNGHDLEWLLDYELTQSTRHRRFVSLVMLSANGSTDKLNSIIEEVVRSSDPFFFLNDAVAVLMGETSSQGAQKAIKRYRELISETMGVNYAVASFPEDGKTQWKLLETAKHRLNVAKP